MFSATLKTWIWEANFMNSQWWSFRVYHPIQVVFRFCLWLVFLSNITASWLTIHSGLLLTSSNNNMKTFPFITAWNITNNQKRLLNISPPSPFSVGGKRDNRNKTKKSVKIVFSWCNFFFNWSPLSCNYIVKQMVLAGWKTGIFRMLNRLLWWWKS